MIQNTQDDFFDLVNKQDEDSNTRLLRLFPKDQAEKVFKQKYCDIEPCFLGFVGVYESLSKIIPKHWTVIDFGCAYNPQSFFFKDHKKYIAVDVSDCEKFKPDNCDVYICSIEEWISENIKDVFQDETFAICSYVPPWGGDNQKLVRNNFQNVFTYYPHGGYDEVVIDVKKDERSVATEAK